MNTILLQPTDVLFFRDGRPMNASLAGHGAAWPLPNVINAAFHAALHRAELNGVHKHHQGARGKFGENARRDRRFGALLTAGPFPVGPDGRWFFPRPLDLLDDTLMPALLPKSEADRKSTSSLPEPLRYAATSGLAGSKENRAKTWLGGEAIAAYLGGQSLPLTQEHAINDGDFCDAEHHIGIGIDPVTGAAGQGEAKSQFYTAHYLRLRDGWRLGVFAKASDKEFAGHDGDLVKALVSDTGGRIIVGGQQRNCTADCRTESPLPLPLGLKTGFHERGGKYLVKWVLLSPAVWPEIPSQSKEGQSMTPHPGGWLPNWINDKTGAVLLRHRAGNIRRDYSGAKARRVAEIDLPIAAELVASIVPKPVVVTGYAMADETNEIESERNGGAPAGAVYYFEAHSEPDAVKLANALNWHGTTEGQEIKNRRSTLLGEKGFGLGVCGTWDFFEGGQ